MNTLTVDAEGWCRAWLASQLSGVTCGTETPADILANLPFVQVLRIGGPDDGLRFDEPTYSIHSYAADRISARALGLRTRNALYASLGVIFNGALAVKVVTISGHAWTPYDDINLRRVTGTYQFTLQPA